MQIFWIIFYHEIVIALRHLAKIFANFLFFIISVTIFFLLAQSQNNQESTLFYSITVIWFSLLSAIIFSAAEFLKKDFDDGTIEQIFTSIDNFEVYIFAKMLANWMICSAPILLAVFPLTYFIGLDFNIATKLILAVLLATIAINFICCFCGSLSVLGNAAPMIAIIALPLIIPVLLISYGSTIADDSSLKILAGLDVFVGTIAVFATAKIVKIAAD